AAAAVILRLIDVEKQRKLLGDAIAKFMPTSRNLDYNLNLPLSRVGVGLLSVVPEGDKPELQLTSKATVDLLRGSATATFEGHTSTNFQIIIGNNGSFLTLHFDAFKFSGGSGRSTKFDAPLKSVTIGPQMAFLAALAAFMGGGDGAAPTNGLYLIPRAAGP